MFRFVSSSVNALVRRRRVPVDSPARVHHVDDPEQPIRLIHVTGEVCHRSIDRLIDEWAHVTAPYALHLDLFDAQITDATAARRLESALDHLERQRIAVRVVGLDPAHPAIAS